MTTAVIWDVDGTLVDTAALHLRAWQKMFRELGRTFTEQDFADTFGRRNPEILRQLLGNHLTDDDVLSLGTQKESYYLEEAMEIGVALLPGVRNLLEGLHARGIPQAVGSSAPKKNLEVILRLTESTPFFGGVIGQEDTARGKPDPEVFLQAAKRVGADPAKCLVFEDAVAGVQAAKASGMKCIAVRFVGHHSADALQAAGADRIVECLSEVSTDDVLRMIG